MTEAIWDLICGAPRHKNALAKSEAWKGSHFLLFSKDALLDPGLVALLVDPLV